MATLGMSQVPICKKSSQRQDEDYEIRNASQETLFETAALIVQDTVAESSVIDSALEDKIPRFELNEMRLGRILGRGGFCIAIEIERVKIAEQTSRGSSTGSNAFVSLFKKSPSKNFTDADISSNVSSNAGSDCPPATVGGCKAYWAPSRDLSRISIAQLAKKRSWRGGRFVLKRVLPELQSSNDVQFLKGIFDLAMESKFLSSLDHPNIIALCGISKHGPSDFIMLERLKETLSKRFRRWTQIDRQCKGVTGIFTGSKRKVAELYEARISAAYDVACAGDYLHQRNIVFRDLKPDNIGFDINENLKIFDFGLAKELRECDRTKNGLYKLTGMTGALRYMAPEVGLGEPYNASCDVYSWSMIMWFILALEPPFGFYTENMIKDRVFTRGSRPAIFDAWSKPVGNLMKRAWSVDVCLRPSFSEVCCSLRLEMVETNRSLGDFTSTASATSVASSPADFQ